MKSEAKPSGGNLPPAEPLLQASQGEELKPCPFCGNEDVHIRPNRIGDYFVMCDSDVEGEEGCGASSSDRRCETEAGAARRWNERAVASERTRESSPRQVEGDRSRADLETALQASQARCRVLEERDWSDETLERYAREIVSAASHYQYAYTEKGAVSVVLDVLSRFRKALSAIGGNHG